MAGKTPKWWKDVLKQRVYEFLHKRKLVKAKESIDKEELNRRIGKRRSVLEKRSRKKGIIGQNARKELQSMNRLGLGKNKGVYKEYRTGHKQSRQEWRGEQLEFVRARRNMGAKELRSKLEYRFHRPFALNSVASIRRKVRE